MTISPVHRSAITLVWFPSLDDIRSGAYLQLVPFRRSLLLRHVLWLPRGTHSACGIPDREFRAPCSAATLHEPRRIWPFDWPAVVVEIDADGPRDVPPPPEPAATLLDLFI